MLRSFFVSAAVSAGLVCGIAAQTVPTGFTVDTLVSAGLNAPHDFCFLPDGRVLIANRAGAVSIYAGAGVTTIGTVANVQTSSEQGLLSIAADPLFDTNGYVYVWYASTLTTFMHLDRFTCTGVLNNPGSTALTLDLTSRRVVLASTPDNAFNHNGGSVRFGPDDMLYLSIGDDALGGCATSSQSTTSSLGCIMRMNVSTLPSGGSTIAPSFSTLDPGTNPLSANADVSQLVIANGLRNPFRMEIDQVTGSLYIGDVGQNAVEEYSEYVYPSVGALPLRNFGWPWREGNNVHTGCGGTMPTLTAPIAAIAQGPWFSVMGGPRYRNQGGQYDFGASYEGSAFYLDYYAGQVRRMVNTGTWVAAPSVPGQPNATNWATGFNFVTALRQGPDGAMWFSQHASSGGTSGGSLKRVRPLGPVNSVTAISGAGQLVNSGESFPQPIVARVFDPSDNPLPFGPVNFAISGSGTLTTTNPVIADANGFAQTSVISSPTIGGPVTVTATTPGGSTNAIFGLYTRRLTVTPVSTLMIVSIANSTPAVPATVPYIVMVSFPHTPVMPTPMGILVTNPYASTTLVLEDASSHFPRASWAGLGGTGTPGLSKVYTPPTGLFSGYRMTFQAVGFDAVLGLFLTNIESKQF